MKYLIIILFVFITFAINSNAQTMYWVGSDYADFMDADNWDVGAYPSIYGYLIIWMNISVLDSQSPTIKSLLVGDVHYNDGTLIIQNGGSLNVTTTVNNIHTGHIILKTGALYIAGGAISSGNSTINLTGGNQSIQGNFDFLEGSSFNIDSSQATISSNLLFRNQSKASINNSTVQFIGPNSFCMLDQTQVKISKSVIDFESIGSFGSSSIEESTFNALSSNISVIYDFKAIGSTINVFGSLYIYSDSIELIDTTINIHPFANFTVFLTMTGKNLTINIFGNFYVAHASKFLCENCTVNVNGNGVFRFNPFSFVNITNTFIVNNGFVFTAAKMYIPLGNKIVNNGTLDYCADIYINQLNNTVDPNQGDPIITNTGKWLCDTPMHNYLNTPFLNTGEIKMTRGNVTFNSLKQTSGSIGLAGGTLFANNTIELEAGSLYGKGLIFADIANQGTIGNQISFNTTDNITILGSLYQNKGQIILNINSNTSHSHLNVSNLFNASNIDIIVYISNDVPTNSSIPIIHYNEFQGNINSVSIRTFDPKTGKPTIYNRCKYHSQQSEKSFAVLVGDDDACDKPGDGGDKIPPGAIIGIVVGLIAAATTLGLLLYYRTNIKLLFKKSYSSQIKMTRNS